MIAINSDLSSPYSLCFPILILGASERWKCWVNTWIMEQVRAMATNRVCPSSSSFSLPSREHILWICSSDDHTPTRHSLPDGWLLWWGERRDRVSVTAIGSIDQNGYFSVDSRTSILWSEWTLHRHSPLIRTFAPIISDSFRGWGALVLPTTRLI